VRSVPLRHAWCVAPCYFDEFLASCSYEASGRELDAGIVREDFDEVDLSRVMATR
jgi:hypothetical protein